jgi:cell division protein FtsI/penicillin-binding protein 2
MSVSRVKFIQLGFIALLSLVVARLFYWQILSGPTLQAIAQTQHQSVVEIPANRGKILASDGFPLANNQAAYTTFAYTPIILFWF